MNANVFMEADKGTLAMKAWPPEIRNKVDSLDKCKLKGLFTNPAQHRWFTRWILIFAIRL